MNCILKRNLKGKTTNQYQKFNFIVSSFVDFSEQKKFKKMKKLTKVILTWEKVEIFIYKHSQKYNLQFRIDFFVHCICVSYICEALHQRFMYTYQLSKGRTSTVEVRVKIK